MDEVFLIQRMDYAVDRLENMVDNMTKSFDRLTAAVERLAPPTIILQAPPDIPSIEDFREKLIEKISNPGPPRTCGECAVRPGPVVSSWWCKGEPRTYLGPGCSEFQSREVKP